MTRYTGADGATIVTSDQKALEAFKEAHPPLDPSKRKFPKDAGGGWYELSNGEKVQGKDRAAQEEAQLLAEAALGSGDDE